MNPTAVTQDREFVLLRLEQSFQQFVTALFQPQGLWLTIPFLLFGALAAVTALVWAGQAVYRVANGIPRPAKPTTLDNALWWAAFAAWVPFVILFLVSFFRNDTLNPATTLSGTGSSDAFGATSSTNTALWLALTIGVFTLGVLFTVWMYVKDSKSIRWYWAALLALLRITVYAIVCAVFLLPAVQTYDRQEKKSRVVILLDVSPSVTTVSDEIGSAPGKKMKTRMGTVIDFLTDGDVAFLNKLLDKNPVYVYRFGTRLDEEAQPFVKGDPAWGRAEWEAFATYDFKPFLLRGLSEVAQEVLRTSDGWVADKPGTPEWAAAWVAAWKGKYERRGDNGQVEKLAPNGVSAEEAAKIHEAVGKLEKRLEVARSIALGTNVPDSVIAAVNREAPNMVQGIVVLSDGRSNLGSDSAFAELRQRAALEKIPIFTIAVGEDRQTVSILITEVQAPDNAPPDEPFKIVVDADGVNLANQDVEVFLDLFLPNKDPKSDPPDFTLPPGKLTFQPGDPPHGQVEFVIDPAKLPDKLTAESTDAAIKKRVLKEGAWTARARIAKDKREAFPDAEHVRDRAGIQVIKKPLKILLVASGPSREYQALKTMLVREVQESRAELSILLQNEGGAAGNIVQDVPPERLLARFPTKLDVSGKPADPKERFYNFNEYDLIIAFDPDWSEVSQAQADDLQRWVQEQGGGLIYVAGPINTFQLARVEPNSRLSPILNILPVLPEDSIVIRTQGTPRTPRRLYLDPIPGSDLLKLEETPDNPIAGWERFFTDREKYARNPDLKIELFPRRGFFSTYPVKDVKPGSKVVANFAALDERGELSLRPWLVTNNPAAGWRTAFMGSGQMFQMFAYDPPTGKEYFERFWVKLMKYTAAKRNAKAARGRVLLSKEYISGAPVRVQARVLDPSARPYPVGAIDPKFKIVQFGPDGAKKKEFGPYEMTAKQGATGFDGYYQGQVMADPKQFPPGEDRYRVVIDVPESSGDTIEGEFLLRKSDPELDNTRPDLPALLAMAGDLRECEPRLVTPGVKERLAAGLPKESGITKLAFKLGDKELLGLLPECMKIEFKNLNNRGEQDHLWDRGFVIPADSWVNPFKTPQKVSYVLLLVVLLLSLEWSGRKLLRLA